MNNQQIQGVCAEAQERQARLTRSFFEASRELVDRVRRGQAADRNFAREEPMDHYVAFLESLFLYSRGDAREEGAKLGAKQVDAP